MDVSPGAFGAYTPAPFGAPPTPGSMAAGAQAGMAMPMMGTTPDAFSSLGVAATPGGGPDDDALFGHGGGIGHTGVGVGVGGGGGGSSSIDFLDGGDSVGSIFDHSSRNRRDDTDQDLHALLNDGFVNF